MIERIELTKQISFAYCGHELLIIPCIYPPTVPSTVPELEPCHALAELLVDGLGVVTPGQLDCATLS